MKIGIKTLLVAGIMGVAVVAGVFEALASPRKKEAELKKEEEKAGAPESGSCDSL